MRSAAAPTRRAGTILLVALALLALMSVSVWAAFGPTVRRGISAALSAAGTPTPTKTARPAEVLPTATVLDLVIVAPNRAATTTPMPEDVAEQTPEPMPEKLAQVISQYGMDPGRRFVVVDIATQTMTVWEPGQPPRDMPVSTGDESRGYRTPAWYGLVGDYWGTFNAMGVFADEGWYLYEDAGAILVHGAPYKLVDGQKVYEQLDALGSYPASRGCIRLRPEDAAWFTAWDPKGVPLVILPRSS